MNHLNEGEYILLVGVRNVAMAALSAKNAFAFIAVDEGMLAFKSPRDAVDWQASQ